MLTNPARKKNLQIILIGGFALLTFLRYGNGYYLVGDSLGYYAHLPALLIDHSLNFGPFFQTCQMPTNVFTDNGLTANIYDCGTSVLWLPFFLVGRLIFKISGLTNLPLCSYPSVYFTNAGTFFLGILTLFLTARILKKIGLKNHSTPVVGICLFGTSLFYYLTFGASMSHGVSAFLIALFAFLCLTRPPRKIQSWYWLLLGFSAGLIVITRINNILYLILLCVPLQRTRKNRVFFLISFFSTVLIQLLIWNKLYGHFLAMPRLPAITLRRFVLGEILFSPFHGLLYWTPLVLCSIGGLFLSWRMPARKTIVLFAAGFCFQLLICSFLEVWWMGYSFGIRYLTDSFVPLAVGLALPLQALREKWKALTILAFYAALALWTMGLFVNYDLSRLPLADIVSTRELFSLQMKIFGSSGDFLKNLFHLPPIFWPGFAACSVFGIVVTSAGRYLNASREYFFKSTTFIFSVLVVGYLLLTVQAYRNTPTSPLSAEKKKGLVMTEDWLQYNFFLYRLTEVQYLLKKGNIQQAALLNNQNIDRFYGTKVWHLWEKASGRTIDKRSVYL